MRTPQGCCRLRFTVRLRRSTLSHSAFFITEAPIRIIRQDDKRIWGLLIGVSATRIKMSVDTVEQLLEQGVHLVGVWVWVLGFGFGFGFGLGLGLGLGVEPARSTPAPCPSARTPTEGTQL